MRGPKPIDPEKQAGLEQKWAVRRRLYWKVGAVAVGLAALLVALRIAQFRAQIEQPRLLSINPDPTVSRDIVPNFEGNAQFSSPMDRGSVEDGIRYYTLTGSRMKGPYLLKERGTFTWSDNDTKVAFKLLPEYYPTPGDRFVIQTSGLHGRNGQPLIPSSFQFRLAVVEKETPFHYGMKDMRDFYKRWKGGDF